VDRIYSICIRATFQPGEILGLIGLLLIFNCLARRFQSPFLPKLQLRFVQNTVKGLAYSTFVRLFFTVKVQI